MWPRLPTAYPEGMALTTVAGEEGFESPTLRARAAVHSSDDVLMLRADDDRLECGLVVLDFDSGDEDEAILVEVFVVPDRRGTGIGSQMLVWAEDRARTGGRTRMSLEAEPLDCDIADDGAKEALIRWYKKRGYREIGGRYDQLEKVLDEAS